MPSIRACASAFSAELSKRTSVRYNSMFVSAMAGKLTSPKTNKAKRRIRFLRLNFYHFGHDNKQLLASEQPKHYFINTIAKPFLERLRACSNNKKGIIDPVRIAIDCDGDKIPRILFYSGQICTFCPFGQLKE
jgi:hypothetical protein